MYIFRRFFSSLNLIICAPQSNIHIAYDKRVINQCFTSIHNNRANVKKKKKSTNSTMFLFIKSNQLVERFRSLIFFIYICQLIAKYNKITT